MSEVCHKCPWWIQLAGKHPVTGENLDRYECAISANVILQVENVRAVRGVQAATESFRNEVVQRADGVPQLTQQVPAHRMVLIENKS